VLDYSGYEGADTIHDLNLPVPESLVGRFDAVVDAGSLEHVFNFPVAVANLMRMARVGGSVFITTPANNLCGHGFYQFSPELMFRVFSPENGFETRRVALVEAVFPSVELTVNRRVHEVTDPAAVGRRAGLLSKRPVMMMVEAVKTAEVPLFAVPPLQSDYVSAWGRGPKSAGGRGSAVRRLFDRLPLPLQRRIRGWRERVVFSLANRRFYRRVR
jgi:hypothetical protein